MSFNKVILKLNNIDFDYFVYDCVQDKKDNLCDHSNILFWISKQDVEPFKMINYKNEDCSTVYSYNVINRQFSTLNFQLVNEFNQPIYDAPDYLLQIQISVFDKDNNYFKEAALQALKLLNDIYFTLLNMISMMVKK